jgi:putative membrane protein
VENLAPPPVDSRYIQANERTFLAWIRTSLALVTFGFVVARLGAWLTEVEATAQRETPPFSAGFLGLCFVVLAVLVDVMATVRYWQVRRALRSGRPVPMDLMPLVFGLFTVVLATLVCIYTFSVVL